MILELISILFSGLALLISGLALREARKMKQTDLRVALGQECRSIERQLFSVASRAHHTKEQWRSLLAAQGGYHSGARIQIEEDVQGKLDRSEALSKRVFEILKELDQMTIPLIERHLVELGEIRTETQYLVDWFAEKDLEHRRRSERDQQQ